MVNVSDALLKSDDGWHRIIATTAQIQLCVVSKWVYCYLVLIGCLRDQLYI